MRDLFPSLRIELDGHVIGNRGRRDDNTCRVDADMARIALYFAGEIYHLLHLGILRVCIRQIGHVLKRTVDRNGETLLAEGDELGNRVAQSV